MKASSDTKVHAHAEGSTTLGDRVSDPPSSPGSNGVGPGSSVTSAITVDPLLLDAASPGGPREPGDDVLATTLRVLDRFKLSIVLLAAVGAFAGLLYAYAQPPLYLAETRILVQRGGGQGVASVNGYDANVPNWRFIETQSDIIRSRAVAERAARHFAAKAPASFARSHTFESERLPANGLFAHLAHAVLDTLAALRSWLPSDPFLRPDEVRPDDGAATRATSEQTSKGANTPSIDSWAARIVASTTVVGSDTSDVLRVQFVSSEPETAAEIVNALAKAYIDFGLEARLETARQASAWLAERLESLRQTVNESEDALALFQAREGLADSRNRDEILSAKLASLTAEQVRARTRVSETEATFRQARSLLDSQPDYEALASLLDNALVLENYRDWVGLDRRVAELGERYGPRHPKMIAATNELEAARRRLRLEADKAVTSLRKSYELAVAQERELVRFVNAQQDQSNALRGKTFELTKLEREVETNRRLYDTFLERFKQADIAQNYDLTSVRVIDQAQAPAGPFSPNQHRSAALGLSLGLLAGLLLAFLRDYLDRTFKTRDDVERVLRVPTLGTVPRIRQNPLRRSRIERLHTDQPRSAFTDAIQDIRTSILFSNIDSPPRTILVTSALPGEGKSTLAMNLAFSFAQRGRTLLLDGDLRNGRLHELVEPSTEIGLTDVVAGEVELKQALVRDTGAQSLYVLTGGHRPPNSLEILSSRRFAAEFERLRRGFHYVVIDAAPLLPISDSLVLGRLADAIVLVVRADSTTHPVVKEAIKRLNGARLPLTGVVLQQHDLRRQHGYGRGYRSAYRRYYGHGT